MRKFIWWMAVCLTVVLAGAGCENDTIGGKLVDEVKGDDKDGESAAVQDVGGRWTGTASTGQVHTVLRLTQNGTSLSGSWTWGAGDTRNCSGYRDGKTIYLWDTSANGDAWTMTLSDDGSNMHGMAKKNGGGSYALNFNR